MRERADGEDVWAQRVVLAVSLCVAVLPAVAAVRAIRWGWVPVGDQAIISTRAADVLTGHSPRLGQLSGVSAEVGLPTRSPGPMGYWPFAVTARWGPSWGTPVVAAVVAGAAMVASVRLAARRGGPGLAVALGLGLVLSSRAINPAGLVSTWNPALGVMPLVLLVMLAWSVGVGELRLVPVAVLVASFCAQVHTVHAVAALPVLVIGVVAGLVPDAGEGDADRPRLRAGSGPALLSGAVVGVLCWALPAIDQVTGDPGNLTRLLRSPSGDPTAWPIVGRVAADALGVPPAFLGGDTLPHEHVAGVLLRPASTPGSVGAVVVVVGLLALGAHAVRRRDRDVGLPVALVLALLAAGAVIVRGTPGELFLTLTYTTWWLVPVGMLAWLVLGWGGARAVGLGESVRRRAPGAGPLVGLAACAAIVALAVLVPMPPEPDEPIHAEAREAGDAVAARVEAGGRYLVTAHGRGPSDLLASTVYRIRRAGARPAVAGNEGTSAGPRYLPEGRRCTGVLALAGDDTDLPPQSTVVARLDVPIRDGSTSTVRITLAPDLGAPSC